SVASIMATVAKIPVIDLASKDEVQVAKDLVDAAVEHGFVYIKNQGNDIPVHAIDGAFDLARKLFASPMEEKTSCPIQKDNRGYSGMHVETLDPANQRVGDFKEAFNFGECKEGKPQQPLPPALTPHADQIGAFFDHCYRLALRLNTLLGIGLATDPPSFFRDAHLRERGPSGSILRMLHYPPLGDAAGASADDVRAGAHSDYGSLTLLFRLRGQAGLEILTPEGSWAPVPVTPPGTEDDPSPPILVNIGDLLSYWTAGLLRSTVHRVVFPVAGGTEGETAVDPRYSMAFFCHPVGNAALEPVPSERVRAEGLKAAAREGNPHALKKDEILTADEHLQMRLRASYAGLYGDEGKE
ncbi:hypothetical protein PspLS_11161, partial [Pyricularia sp. CBS 133598]